MLDALVSIFVHAVPAAEFRRHSRWVYFLPLLHLGACMMLPLAYLVPAPVRDYFATVWVGVMVIDLPVSFVAMALAWGYGFLAVCWIFVVGTLWWYALSLAAERLVRRFRH